MKICIDCNQELELNLFPYDKSRNRYLSVCKPCTSIRTQNYRKLNPKKWRKYDKNRNENVKSIINEWKEGGCVKCGETRVWTLDAHHIDPSKKEYAIGDISHGPNKVRLELDKCVVLCSNCHRDFHYLEKKDGINIKEYVKILATHK
jgi:ferredoxin-like protein FixX